MNRRAPQPSGETKRPDARTQGSGLDRARAHPTRPSPEPSTGELRIDPEIVLPGKGLDLQVEFYYLGGSSINGPFGQSRSASVNASVQVGSNGARIFRGDGTTAAYQPSVTLAGTTYYVSVQSEYSPTTITSDATGVMERYPSGFIASISTPSRAPTRPSSC